VNRLDHDLSRLLRLAGPRPRVPADAEARVRAAVHREWTRTLCVRRRVLWAGLAAAAAVVATAGLVLRPAPPPTAPPSVVAVVEHVSGRAVLARGTVIRSGDWLQTPDDGRVALRVGGRLSLRVDTKTRLQLRSPSAVWLERGAVYVDTGEGHAEDAIRIHTPEGEVREVGTQFQVRVAPASVQVSVRSGEIVLVREQGSHSAAAGVGLDVEGGAVRSRAVAPFGVAWSWIEAATPAYALDGRRLDDLLRWAARETGLAIHFEDEVLARSAARITLHGSTEGLTPREALDAVLPAAGLTVRDDDGGRLVVRRAR
jgi:ferric-dicitrate binding protein FerR (iron transport regulator)